MGEPLSRTRLFALALALVAARPALGDERADAQAKARYSEGETALRLGHYQDAIEAFEDAYRLSQRVEILFNIGLAYRRAYGVVDKPEYLRRALEIYRTFERLARSPEERRAAAQVISEIEPQVRAIDDRERMARLQSQGAPGPLQAAIRLDAEGKAADAVRTLDALLRKGHNGPDMVADIYRLEAEMAADAGPWGPKFSTGAFERLLSVNPEYRLPANASARERQSFAAARAFSAGRPALAISHVVPPPAAPNQPLPLSVAVENDALGMMRTLVVGYRQAGRRSFSTVSRAGEGELLIPGIDLPAEEKSYRVEYYVEGLDRYGNVLSSIGSERAPLSFPVMSKEEVAEAESARRPWYGRPWTWVGIGLGVAAVAGTVAAVAMSQRGPPASDYGVLQTLQH